MIFAINYDLKRQGQNYEGLYDAIKSCGDWNHVLASTWLVSTNLSASGIWAKLSPQGDSNDRVLIAKIGVDDYGWLAKDVWDWIAARR